MLPQAESGRDDCQERDHGAVEHEHDHEIRNADPDQRRLSQQIGTARANRRVEVMGRRREARLEAAPRVDRRCQSEHCGQSIDARDAQLRCECCSEERPDGETDSLSRDIGDRQVAGCARGAVGDVGDPDPEGRDDTDRVQDPRHDQ